MGAGGQKRCRQAQYLVMVVAADARSPAPGSDLALSRDALAGAAGALRTSHPAAMPVVNRLTALLDRASPAGRVRPKVSVPALFLVDPRRDRGDAELLRKAFYPDARLLSPATVDSALAGLTTPILHLGCAVTPAGALRLADDTELPPERIREAKTADGLAVLPPTGVGLPALGDALLAAGFRGVVTWKRVVPSRVAALMSFVLHAALADDHLDPAEAVAHVRDWMRDPHRPRPSHLPGAYGVTFARRDLVDEAYWSALVFRGP